MQAQCQILRKSKPLMAAKILTARPTRRQTLRAKMQRSRVPFVISQPMHGGGSSTCPSKYLTKCGSISIVNTAHLNVKLIIANNPTPAIDDIIKVHIFFHNEIYAFDHSLTYHMFAHLIKFSIKDIVLCIGNSISRDKNF